MKKAIVAIVAFALFLSLGFAVSRHGEPPWLITWDVALQNHATLIAWWLTWACYAPVLLPIAIVLLVVAWRVPAWRTRSLFGLAMLLLCWQGADAFQHVFMRPRRLDWVVKHETAFSYPSSHAAIAFGFYLLWAGMLYWSELPRAARVVSSALLTLLVVAVCWSRLALGAHYATDLLGGALLAVAFVAGALAVVPLRVFAPRAEV